MKKLNLSAGTFLAIISFSIAGSVIYELPYIKYVYYDKFVEAFGMTNAQAGFLLYRMSDTVYTGRYTGGQVLY